MQLKLLVTLRSDTDADATSRKRQRGRQRKREHQNENDETTNHERKGNHGAVLAARPDVRQGTLGVLRRAAAPLQYAVDDGAHTREEGVPGS